ncbi:MAG: hypothetical protein Mars2KO_30570 [Maribacter sp.]
MENEKYLWFDNLIGQTNSGVFKGVRYTNEFRTINEKHQFFQTTDFRTGSITYMGQDYFELQMQYDVYLDQLLVMNGALPNRPIMFFDKQGVARFSIEGHSFEHLTYTTSNEKKSGFFEVLLKNESLRLYKKHSRKIFKRTDAQNLYYEFKDGHSYLLQSGSTYYPFKKVKELNGIFPEYRKEIKPILKRHVALKNSDTDAYVRAVLNDVLALKPIPKKDAL